MGIFRMWILLLLAIFIGCIIICNSAKIKASTSNSAYEQSMEKLWIDHVLWTRIYIIDVVSKSLEAPFSRTRLLQNQADIANLIGSNHPDLQSNLHELLVEHIAIAEKIVLALLSKQAPSELSKLNEQWHANADSISTLLGSNDKKLIETIKQMMYAHLSLTSDEVVAIIAGDWQKSIKIFDSVEQEAVEMAHDLSGI